MAIRARKNRRTVAALAVLVAGLGAVAALSNTPADAAKTAAVVTPPAPDCGTTVVKKVDGTRWVCTFGDDFTAKALDQTKWSPQLTSTSGFNTGGACYTDNAANVAVSSGTLKLTSKRALFASTCKSPRGNFSSRYTSGMVTTYTKFTQTYGRFEMRAKFSTTKQPGVQSSFWMYPAVTDAIWPTNGEIDIAEWYSKYPTLVIPFLHYSTSYLDVTSTNNTCKVANVGSAWHTYAVEWTPKYISFIYDGQTCLTNTVAAGGYPFNKAYMLALSQLVGTDTNAPNILTPSAGTMEVDYVHGWA
jgi:beta-glucanase (GH16 family)